MPFGYVWTSLLGKNIDGPKYKEVLIVDFIDPSNNLYFNKYPSVDGFPAKFFEGADEVENVEVIKEKNVIPKKQEVLEFAI